MIYGGDGGGVDPRMQLIAAIQAARGQKNAGGYVSPTQRIAALRAQLSGEGEPEAAVNANIQNGANSYAQKRLGQFSQIADMLGGDFAKQFHSQDMSDPAAAYRALSGGFAQASQGKGIQDPRVLLQQLLMQSHGQGGQANQATAPRSHQFSSSPRYALDARSAALNAKYNLGGMPNAYTDGQKRFG